MTDAKSQQVALCRLDGKNEPVEELTLRFTTNPSYTDRVDEKHMRIQGFVGSGAGNAREPESSTGVWPLQVFRE